MGIEEQIDRLIDLGEDIKSRLDRLIEQGVMLKQPVGDRFVLPPESEMNSITFGEAIKKAKNHFAGANKMVAEEQPKKWRILEPGEVVCSSDWICARSNLPSDPPNGLGWKPQIFSTGISVSKHDECVFARPVADEPAKEAEHPAGPMPDPGEGYRILSKDPPEDLRDGDEFEAGNGKWIRSSNAETDKKQSANCWYRRKIEAANQPDPAWEPKVGDWVRVTRPIDWIEWEHPKWEGSMHQFDGQVGQIECEWGGHFQIRGFAASNDFRYQFHRDWLSPAEPPAIDKPPEPKYREPVLPGDAGKECEVSDDGKTWVGGKVYGWRVAPDSWWAWGRWHRFARIKVDA